MSPRSFAVVVTVLLLLPVGAVPAAVAGGGTAASPAGHPGAVGASVAPHEGSLDEGEIEMRIEVAADGDARWRVKTVISDSIDTADERAAFRDFVDDFNETESPLALDTFVEGASNASRATGREMVVRNVERHHALHNGTGAVWVTFTWTNFGETDGDRLAIDDAFNTTSGVWLPSLAASETLVVVPPSGYGVSSAPTSGPAAASDLSAGVARWEGPQDFGDRGPWIVYSGDAPTATPTDSRPPTGTATGTPDDPGTGTGTGGVGPGGDGDGDGVLPGALPFVAVVVVGGASAALLVAYMRRDDDGLGGLIGTGDGPDPDAGTAAGDGATADASAGGASGVGSAGDTSSAAAGSAADGATGDAGAGAAAGAAAGASGTTDAADTDDTDAASADGADDEDDGIDEELLSDEERVERLIEQNGGRMKQAAIVQETGWSNAKVSQLLSAMDEEDRIDKLRIGRENLISFPDEDVTDLDSE
ncbi:helix-turn-helix transcriptional regulator [Halosimplex halobium]|uniref:helix-turn-helix transcriptional regulator n=1 Tax=Halosimplex halobium TaxID=3396618 RepID=UPI003F543CAA